MAQTSALNVLQDWLDSYLNFEKLPRKDMFWLDTIRFLCNRFDNPQNSCPSFHVAGSKGKGSVSALISSILTENGSVCGLYTSPHILNFNERIGYAHGPFPEYIYEDTVKEIMRGVDSIIPDTLPGGRPVTWFELVTLYAFLCFRHAHVDQAVYEVGMGGRLDATNVIQPQVCIITPIELEHTEYLGDTLEKIAAEKAGIMKRSIPVFSAPQKECVRKVFREKAEKVGTTCTFVDNLNTIVKNKFLSKDGQKRNLPIMAIHLECPLFARPINTDMHLLGTFQAHNALLAAIAVKSVFPEINEDIIERGIAKTVLPGRFELVSSAEYPDIDEIVQDGAHTVNSVRFTLQTFRELFAGKTAHLLFACAADKHIETIASLFGATFSTITITRPGEAKQADMPRLKKALSANGLSYTVDEDYTKAIRTALAKADREHAVLLVTGSFYLVAEVKKILAIDSSLQSA